MTGILANGRVLQGHTTGVQRYLRGFLARMPDVACVEPRSVLQGPTGHAWEQFRLPTLARGQLLWSPSNSGPLLMHNQVVTIHDVAALDHPEWFNFRFAKWYRYLIPRLVRRVRHVIVVSEFTRRRLIAHSGIDEGKVTVIHCGVDDRFCRQPEDKITIARTKLEIPRGRYILSIGSLEPRKNLGRLLLAWEKLLTAMPNDVWLVLGGAKGKSLIFGDVPELRKLPERVILTGYVPDDCLPALYAGAQAFVYPSIYEGFGLPPLEAMSCGTPVIVGNRASLPEVVGNATLSVDPYNVDALARALLDVVTYPALAGRLHVAGLSRAGRFTWEKAAQETQSVLFSTAVECQ